MSREKVDIDKPWAKTIPFSLGVVVEGRLLYTAGITARDPEGNVVGAGDIAAQTRQCFENVGDILREVGADFGDVVKWTMYTTDIDTFVAEAADVWRSYFVDKPASTLVEVRRLQDSAMLVEIEAVVRLKS